MENTTQASRAWFSCAKVATECHPDSGLLNTTDILGELILCTGAVLCIVGGLAGPLACTCWMPVATPHFNQICLQTLPDIPWEQNCPRLRPAALEKQLSHSSTVKSLGSANKYTLMPGSPP